MVNLVQSQFGSERDPQLLQTPCGMFWVRRGSVFVPTDIRGVCAQQMCLLCQDYRQSLHA